MIKREKLNIGFLIVSVLVAAGASVFGFNAGENYAIQEMADTAVLAPVIEPPALPPVIIEVDGIGCVISEQPVLTYYAATDVVRLNIECDGNMLNYYRPALVPVDPQ